MAAQRKIRRYTAYFRGWAQAFGEHEGVDNDSGELYWLLGNNQVGLVLTPALKRLLFRELLGRGGNPPTLRLDGTGLQVGERRVDTTQVDPRVMEAIVGLLASPGDLHLYQTYHLYFQAGTRILTLSKAQPLVIIYKEIEPYYVDVARINLSVEPWDH